MPPVSLVLPLSLTRPERDTPVSVFTPPGAPLRAVVVHTNEQGVLTRIVEKAFAAGSTDSLNIPPRPDLGGPMMARLSQRGSTEARGLAVLLIPGKISPSDDDIQTLLKGGWGISDKGPFPRGTTLTLPEGASFKVGGGWQGAHCLHEAEIAETVELTRVASAPGVTRFALIGQALTKAPREGDLVWEAVVMRGTTAVVGIPSWSTVDGTDVVVLDLDALADAKGLSDDRRVTLFLEGEPVQPPHRAMEVGDTATLPVPSLGTELDVRADAKGPVVIKVRQVDGAPRLVRTRVFPGGRWSRRVVDFARLRKSIEAGVEAADGEGGEGDAGSGYRSGVVQKDRSPNAPWALILPEAEQDDLLRRLNPLIKHRETHLEVMEPFIFPTLSPTDDVEKVLTGWMEDNAESLSKVSYLLIAGSVPALPFALEHRLGSDTHLGRLGFDDPSDYDAYAEKVVRMERAHPEPSPWPRLLGVAPDRYGPAYQSAYGIFEPIEARLRGEEADSKPRVGRDARWVDAFEDLQGQAQEPALLAFFGHGAALDPYGGSEAGAVVGALIDQTDSILGAESIPPTPFLKRGVAFLFACNGGAWREREEIDLKGGRRLGEDGSAQISALPQALLAHPEGPLGVIAHLDPILELGLRDSRGRSAFGRRHPTVSALERTLSALLKNRPIGVAILPLRNLGAIARADLGTYARDLLKGRNAPLDLELQEDLVTLFIRQVDGLNWLALGDPRVSMGGSSGRASAIGFRSPDDT